MARETVDLHTWRERLSETFLRLDVKPLGSETPLRTRIARATNGRIRAATIDVVGEPHLVRRTPTCVHTDAGGLLVSVQLRGTCVVRQSEREALLEPGDVAFYDARQPYDLVFPSGTHRQAVIQVSATESPALTSLLNRTAVRVPGARGLGRAVAALLTSIPDSIQDTEAVEAERLTHSGLSLLALSLSSDSKVARSAELLDQARSFVEAHADDAQLNPSTIAAGLHISASHLHRTFRQSNTTVSELVKNVRLDRAAADLRDQKLQHWTIAQIACRRGFSDPAHFSRSFTTRFGVPPSRWRHAPDPSR